MPRVLSEDTPVRLSLAISAALVAVTIASAAGVALYQTNSHASSIKETQAKGQAHDLQLQRLSDALEVLKESSRRQEEKLDRLLRRSER